MTDKNKYKNIKFQIKEIKNHPNGDFNVIIKTDNGTSSISFDKTKRIIHPVSGKPKFIHRIKEYLEKKYSERVIKETFDTDNIIGQDYNSEDIEDYSVETLSKERQIIKDKKYEEIKNNKLKEKDKLQEMLKIIQENRQLKSEVKKEQKMLESEIKKAKTSTNDSDCKDCTTNIPKQP